MKRNIILLSFVLLCLFMTFYPVFAQGTQGQVMGIITQISPQGFQITTQTGQTFNVTVSSQTMICNAAKAPGNYSQFGELRAQDIVIVMGTQQQDGSINAAQVGFLHQGEQMNPGWQSNNPQTYNNSSQQYNPCPNNNNQNQCNQNGTPGYTPNNSSYNVTPSNQNGTPGYTPNNSSYNVAPAYNNNMSASSGNITDPQGHFTCNLPSGWTAGGKMPNGCTMYMKQSTNGCAMFAIMSTPLPPQGQGMDAMAIGQCNEQQYAQSGQSSGYKKVSLNHLTVSGKDTSCLAWTYKGMDGQTYYAEEYYVLTGSTIVTLHFETYQNMVQAVSSDIKEVINNVEIK